MEREEAIEEKAKAYDEAIKIAKEELKEADAIEYNLPDSAHAIRTTVYYLFPELAESEDERIRKGLLYVIEHHPTLPTEEAEEYIAWLEKQGEQKTSEWRQDNIKELTEFEAAMLHIGESFFGKNHGLNSNDTSVVKEQAMLLLEFVANKPAWSEEDEENNKNILYILNQLKGTAIYKEDKTAENCIDWLKSLKDRYIWKPSDEQIKVCKEVYADILSAKGFDLGTVLSELNRLEEELKKLKG